MLPDGGGDAQWKTVLTPFRAGYRSWRSKQRPKNHSCFTQVNTLLTLPLSNLGHVGVLPFNNSTINTEIHSHCKRVKQHISTWHRNHIVPLTAPLPITWAQIKTGLGQEKPVGSRERQHLCLCASWVVGGWGTIQGTWS